MLILVVAIFMTTAASEPIWRTFSLLQNIQFPWRFHVIVVVSLTAILTILMAHGDKSRGDGVYFAGIILIVILAWGFPLSKQDYWNARARLSRMTMPIAVRNKQVENLSQRTGSVFSYLPVWALARQREWVRMPHEKIQTSASVNLTQWSVHGIEFEYNSDSHKTVTIGQLYFPGWRALHLNSGQALSVKPDSLFGLVQFDVPPGGGRVRIAFESTPSMKLGETVSAVAVMLLAAVAFSTRAHTLFSKSCC